MHSQPSAFTQHLIITVHVPGHERASDPSRAEGGTLSGRRRQPGREQRASRGHASLRRRLLPVLSAAAAAASTRTPPSPARAISIWDPMQIYADVKDHVVFVVDPPYEQRGGFFLLCTVVFRLAMLQSLLYPAPLWRRLLGNISSHFSPSRPTHRAAHR